MTEPLDPMLPWIESMDNERFEAILAAHPFPWHVEVAVRQADYVIYLVDTDDVILASRTSKKQPLQSEIDMLSLIAFTMNATARNFGEGEEEEA